MRKAALLLALSALACQPVSTPSSGSRGSYTRMMAARGLLGSEDKSSESAGGQGQTSPRAKAAATTEEPAPTPTSTIEPSTTQPSTGACGGSLPPCYVLARESRGDIHAVNPVSGAAGKWQMILSTSLALGYTLPMNYYGESVQDDAARTLWDSGNGCRHWEACR